MARVDYTPFPTVPPQESAPNDVRRIQANPEEFGAAIARGAEKLGQGALGAAKFFGEVAADNASNEFQDRATKILRGDPSKTTTGPDGQPQPDLGYLGTKGRGALDARPGVEEQFDNLQTDIRSKLQTPEQQLQFDNFTRRYRNYLTGEIGTHADREANVWYGEVNGASANLAMTHIAQHYDDPVEVAHGARDLIDARVKQAELQGGGAELRQQAVNEGKAEALSAQLNAMAIKDPSRALKILDQNKNIASVVDKRTGVSYYDTLASAFRSRAEHQNGVTAAAGAVDKARKDIGTGAHISTLPQMQDAIYGQESGRGANTTTSPTGAVGGMQIEPATFQQYARPGENLYNDADNRAVGNRILADYWQRYGGDPARVAVAYFSGPGNVAPAGSATPWIKDRNDGRTSVSQYVAQVSGQQVGIMPNGMPQVSADPYALHALAMRNVMRDDTLNDNEKNYAMADLQRSFTQAQIAAEADTKARKDRNDQARDNYTTQLFSLARSSPQQVPGLIERVEADPNLDSQSKIALSNFARNKFGIDDTTQYGSGYANAYGRIFLPPGDPNRIGDANTILQMGAPGGDLTTRGTERLLAVYNSAHKDPDQAAVNQTKASLLKYAQQKLSFDQEMLFPGVPPLRDPKGVQAFDGVFVPRFEAAFDAWVKQGKNPWEFLTKDNMDKLMEGVRPKAQMAMDKVAATGTATDEKGTAQAMPSAPQGISDQAWQGLMATRPVLENNQPIPPENWAKAIAALQADPSDKTVKYFDEAFPGFDGRKILEQMATQTPGAPAVPTQEATPPAPWYQRMLKPTLLPPDLRPAEYPAIPFDEHMSPPTLGIRG